jgi:hypothetical protein
MEKDHADERTVHGYLASLAKEQVYESQASGGQEPVSAAEIRDTVKRMVAGPYSDYVGQTPLDQVIDQNLSGAIAKAQAEARKSSGSWGSEDIVRDAKNQGLI